MRKLPKISELSELFKSLKSWITDDMIDPDSDSKIPIMQVTIGSDLDGNWSYQTGDNSFTGEAYHYRFWGVVYLTRRSNSRELAREVINQLSDCYGAFV